MIQFFVPGKPRSRQSVTVGKGGKAFYHRNNDAQAWKDRVHAIALQNRPERPLECPVKVSLTFQFEFSKTHKNELWVSSRPDLDNLEKPLMDAMNGVIFKDDSQVVSKDVRKIYSLEPGCLVTVEVIQ